MKSSPLAPLLHLAASQGAADVIALVSRRHKPVRGTHFPHAPGPSPDLDVASLLLRAATCLSEAHDVAAEHDDTDAAESYRAEAWGYVAKACAMREPGR